MIDQIIPGKTYPSVVTLEHQQYLGIIRYEFSSGPAGTFMKTFINGKPISHAVDNDNVTLVTKLLVRLKSLEKIGGQYVIWKIKSIGK